MVKGSQGLFNIYYFDIGHQAFSHFKTRFLFQTITLLFRIINSVKHFIIEQLKFRNHQRNSI